MSKSVAVIALFAVPAGAIAQAPDTCLTEPEAMALFDYALPELLNTVADKCAPELPRTSFLASRAPELVKQYRASGSANWPLARAAFTKTAATKEDDAKIFAALPDDTLKSLLTAGLGVAIAGDIKVADCPRIDKIIAALAPLPSSNLSALIVQIMALDSDKPGEAGDFRICRG